MSFAEPNQILVSRSYYEVVSRLAPDYAQLFQYVGLHRDKHVREHEVYEVHLATPLGRAGGGAGRQRPRGRPIPRSMRRPPAERTVRLDPAFIERLTSALAREIGPVAKLIVQRAAERAADEGALDGRRGRARARREPRRLSRPSVGPAGTAARLGAGPRRCRPPRRRISRDRRGRRRRDRPRGSDPRSSPGSSRC